MSWMPSRDPKLGDPTSCDALDLIIVPRARDIGGFEVRRALPSIRRKLVGPFIFFDRMGPATFRPGEAIDVRPHPHLGLSTVTYLYDGTIRHRDSLGTEMVIAPGDINLMTAGRGIVHSERSPEETRSTARRMLLPGPAFEGSSLSGANMAPSPVDRLMMTSTPLSRMRPTIS